MSQSCQFYSWKPTDGNSCVPVSIVCIAGNCGNYAFPEMTRHFWKCLEFSQLPRCFQKINLKFKCSNSGKQHNN